MLHGIEVSRAAAILKNIETYESAHYPSRRYIIIMITYFRTYFISNDNR